MRNHQIETMVLWSWEHRDDDHPRPAEIARLEALLNTVDHHRFGAHASKPARQRDLLSTADGLARWPVDHGLLEPHQHLAAADGAALRELRDSLREHLERRDRGEPVGHGWSPVLLGLRLRVDPEASGLELAPASDGVAAVLERLLADAVVAQARGTLQRLKVCAAPDCRFAYYDRSRSRTSRWCSMQTCGNRAKTRLYRQRQR